MGRPDGPVRVLHVDADTSFAQTAAASLERADDRLSVTTATDAETALARVRDAPVDCLISEYRLPDRTGLELLEAVRATDSDVPFVLLTDADREDLASEAVAAGVTDYCRKPDDDGQYEVLANRIRQAVDRSRTVDDFEQYQNVFDAAGDAVYTLDLDGRMTMVNGPMVEWSGYDREELLGEHVSILLDECDIERGREAVRELLTTDREVVEYEETIHTADSGHIPAEVRVTLLEENGRAVGTTGFMRDISERQQRRRERQRYETIFEQLDDAVYVLDEDERLVYVNDSYAEMKGVSRETLLGDRITDWAYDKTVERVREVREEIRAGEREVGVIEKDFTTADGELIPAELRVMNISREDGTTERVGVIRDISDRKEYEHRLAALSETVTELMAATTREEVAETAVETARDVLGLDANALHLHDPERDLLVPAAVTDAGRELVGETPSFAPGNSIAWRVFASGEGQAIDDVHDHPDVHNPDTPVHGEVIVPVGERGIIVAGSPTLEAFDQRDVALGEILGDNVATALDQVERTTELRAREQELERQNERLEEFAGVVSHDLRNPLNVAQSRLELAAGDDDPHTDAAMDALNRSQALIDDLLALAREGEAATDPVPVDLADLVEDCWRTVATAEASLAVTTDRTVRADEGRLKQVFENLFRNAVEHGSTSPDSQARQDAVEHGSTGSRTQSDDAVKHAGEDVRVEVGHLADGFYVADDGPGVPEGEREDVFEAGYSQAEDGTGFGLSIVKEIADAHGWMVRVTDSEAGGARFEFVGVEVGPAPAAEDRARQA